MCGIAGYAGRPALDADQLGGMADALSHRGPDDQGTWLSPDGSVGLTHRRLAIIDLSPGGHQPMQDAGGRVHLSFNGEIYNYREVRDELIAKGHTFRSASDTEVILEAYKEWGEPFIERLVGQFAMALFDEKTRQLFLIRDRAGEKPLFVWRTPSRITFASELKAILTLPDAPKRLDREAVQHYLAWGYVSGAKCLLEGVEKLPPASIMRIDVDSGATQTRRYWELPVLHETAAHPDELLERLETLLRAAVRRQMVADVPLGILLSGGIDSSLVTAMAAQTSSRPVKTFNVSFPGHAAYDESPWARIVAEHFGTEHTELHGQEASIDLLDQLAAQYDEPIGDASMVPTYLVSRAIRQHATVALGGDGGDELFGGYHTYSWTLSLDRIRSRTPAFVRKPAAAIARRLPVTTRGRNVVLAMGESGFNALGRTNLFFSSEWRHRLLAFNGTSDSAPERDRIALANGATSLVQAAMRADFRSYMVDDILVKVDRASMLTSLEVRSPFLDPAVIEFAFGSVPDSLKVTPKERKVLLRRLAKKLLPSQLDLTRKQGFAIPLDAWFAGQWGARMRDVLSQSDPHLFRPEAIAEIFAGHERWNNQVHRLFALTMFELWRRHYGIHL
jgi:asparagine synthase (glutamine-hydrolysing)